MPIQSIPDADEREHDRDERAADRDGEQCGEQGLDAVERAVELGRRVVEEHDRQVREHVVDRTGVRAGGEHVRVEWVEDVGLGERLGQTARVLEVLHGLQGVLEAGPEPAVTHGLERLGAWPSRW